MARVFVFCRLVRLHETALCSVYTVVQMGAVLIDNKYVGVQIRSAGRVARI